MSNTLAIYWRFLVAGLVKLNQTGAVVPSQRFLISKMISPIPPTYSGPILELGAGTGALTRRLAARCPKAHILACEINPVLAKDLEYCLTASGCNRNVKVVSDSAQHILEGMRKNRSKRVDFVLSGIPLGNLDREQVLELIGAISNALNPGGLYIQFQYSLVDRRNIQSRFNKLRTAPAFLNFPPAFVYYARK